VAGAGVRGWGWQTFGSDSAWRERNLKSVHMVSGVTRFEGETLHPTREGPPRTGLGSIQLHVPFPVGVHRARRLMIVNPARLPGSILVNMGWGLPPRKPRPVTNWGG
jgi:hypothetical protein